MAVIGDQLLSRVFGHSKAEKCFHTSWDTVQDYMVYSLATLSIITMPTTLVVTQPLHCNFVSNVDTATSLGNSSIDLSVDPKFNLWWVRKICLLNGSVSHITLYLPYILLIVALILFAIQRVFSKAWKSGLKFVKLYKILIHRHIVDENNDETDNKEITDAKKTFKRSRNYYNIFLLKY